MFGHAVSSSATRYLSSWRRFTSAEDDDTRSSATWSSNKNGSGCCAAMTAFVDTNILVRHLIGHPPEIAARATAYLRSETGLQLTDLVAAETHWEQCGHRHRILSVVE